MLTAATTATDRYLHAYGFARPEVRTLVRTQVAVAAIACVLALVLLALGAVAAAWSLVVGTVLATVNFAHLARFAQEIVFVEKGAVTALLIRFYFRLFVTGAILYGCIAYMGASVAGLLAGLSTVVPTAVCWGLTRHAR